MKVSKSDWHYRFNSWVYGRNNIPKSLCLYFWKVVFGFFIALFSLPAFLIGYVIHRILDSKKEADFTLSNRNGDGIFSYTTGMWGLLLGAVVSFMVGVLILSFFPFIWNTEGKLIIMVVESYGIFITTIVGFGFALVVIGSIIGLYVLDDEYGYVFRQWKRIRKLASGKYKLDQWDNIIRIESIKRPGLFSSMWVAVKDSVCPMIEIIGDDDDETV